MMFDYVNSVNDKRPKVCLYEQFLHLVRQPLVAQLIKRYRAGEAEAKRQLPAFCFHASYGGRPRAAKNAQPSGLVMADFDHLPQEQMERLPAALREAPRELGIMLAHVTPSGQGLRVVIKAQRNTMYDGCRSVGDFQRRLALALALEEWLDPVAHDMARLSFCPQESDILFLTKRLFTEAPEVCTFDGPAPAAAPSQPAATASTQSEYEHTPLSDIFAHYFELTGGLPQEGGRNARFYGAARDLRYICDFNPSVLARHMPDVGLSPEEVLSVCTSACQSSRASRIPAAVEEALALAAAATAPDDALAAPAAETQEADVKLPSIFRPLVACCPPGFRDAAVLALLPMVGTMATGVRARYLDGELHSPSFVTVVTAEQASGKSFTRRLVDVVLHQLRDADAAARAVENAYRLELRRKKNAKEQPVDPRAVIRLVPASVSVAKLLQRLDYADGKHIFSFAEELDTVIKSNQGGAWSQKSDIYRNAFDNAEYGQDYMSENSYSATVRVFYNLLFLGTPRQTRRFFQDVENGLVSRCCFAQLPDGFGQAMPVMGALSDAQREDLQRQLSTLAAVNGEVSADFLLPPLNAWLEEQRTLALKENNRARDIFRKRAAVMGFRAAAMLVPLYVRSGKNQALLRDFALYIAQLVLRNQLSFAGEKLNALLNSAPSDKTRSAQLFDSLSGRFTLSDLSAALAKSGMKSPARTLVYLWQKNGFIEKSGFEKNTYMKIQPSKPKKK